MWVYYTIPFGFSLFWHFWYISFFETTFLLRIPDEGSVPTMRIWSILLINSDSKWCIYPSISLFIFAFCLDLLQKLCLPILTTNLQVYFYKINSVSWFYGRNICNKTNKFDLILWEYEISIHLRTPVMVWWFLAEHQ